MAGRRRVSLGISDTIKLDVGQSDAIGIAINEPGNQSAATGLPSPAPWGIDVFAWMVEARVFVGHLDAVPDPLGRVSERLIGHAVCPGAEAWAIEITGPSAAQANAAAYSWWAEFDGFATPCCSQPGTGTGVFYPRGRVVTPAAAPLASSRVVAAFPVRFRGAFGSNESGAQAWLMFFDSTTVPANGTQPIAGLALDVQASATFNLSLDPTLTMLTGMTWAVSSTPDTLTAVAGNFRVVTRLEW